MTQSSLFRETQYIRSKWLWAFITLIGIFFLMWRTVIGLVVLLMTAALLYSIRLKTEVRKDGVYIQFAPFHWSYRRIPPEKIEKVELTEFGLLTYGGIGMRWTPNTTAYMTNPGSGIKIDRPDRKSVIIGSQDPEKLAETVDNLKSIK